ncbi:MAG TPA: hypothetical protein VJY12_10625 [Dysgonamonadaceae bacterium]|nr:hypothetical protein [Dysgonamonadaceae bacterium]
MSIYIVSSKGAQAQETFLKLEDIAKQRIESIPSLKDIFINEVVKASNSDGFSHDKASFKVSVFNGSTTFTLNSVPDNVRGKRAQLLLIDESAFCSEDLISVVLPFITQNTDFKISTDETYDTRTLRKQVPTQLIYSSSANGVEGRHYNAYREFAMRMIMGDSRYFACDIPCDIPLAPMVDGEFTAPLLEKQQIDDDMRSNPDKAMREYYNKFQTDGGESQIIKWGSIRRNETFTLPQMANSGKDRFVLSLDPARTTDNSILSVMKIVYDDKIGYYGEVVNCTSLMDLGKRKKTPMRTTEQIKHIKQSILDYNGNAPDYQNIDAIMIDSGAGGGGISAFADNFIEDWVDDGGILRAGMIDPTHEQYSDSLKTYPNAKPIVRLISPNKYKTQMVGELIELMRTDLIKFPKEYDGKMEVPIGINSSDNEVDIQYKTLSVEEQVALINLDIMKTETTSIHKFENPEKTSVRYALPKEKERLLNDDRFYTLIMLAHYLYELRRDDQRNKNKQPRHSLKDYFFTNQSN